MEEKYYIFEITGISGVTTLTKLVGVTKNLASYSLKKDQDYLIIKGTTLINIEHPKKKGKEK